MPRTALSCCLSGILSVAVGLTLSAGAIAADEKLFVAEPLTQPKEFTGGIE